MIIGMVGLPGAGKSTLAKALSEELGISYVNGDKMRDFFINNISYFHGTEYSYSNPKIRQINKLVRPLADDLSKSCSAVKNQS